MNSSKLNEIYEASKDNVEVLFDAVKQYYLVICMSLKILVEYRDDIIQDSLLKLWKVIDKYDPAKAKFATFCSRIFRNALADWAERNGRYNSRYSSLTPLLEFEVV